MANQPILLVHEAAHTGAYWQLLKPELESRGFEPYAITLPGHAPRTCNGWLITMKRSYVFQGSLDRKFANGTYFMYSEK